MVKNSPGAAEYCTKQDVLHHHCISFSHRHVRISHSTPGGKTADEVRATVELRIVFSEAVASRNTESWLLSRLTAPSFEIDAPNGTEILEVRVSSAAGMDAGSTRSSTKAGAGRKSA